MPKVTFVQADGERRTVDAVHQATVMRTAVDNGIRGIAATCGGVLSCATCHVYVDTAQLVQLPAPAVRELETLEFTLAERKPNSRLSCQLTVDKKMEELIVYLPDTQI
ncbi:MAG: 2Fe-2S iron-sulfur cluster binding domain-containing protein [Burkholderiales bacterium]|nr:2Fe-2S iron-sulfur cluster binding domain-containing protein [Burkholderiales bacterium]